MSELVVKDNALINASYSLSLVEQRLILLAIVTARRDDHNMAWDIFLGKPIEISASEYVEAFGVSRQNAYMALQDACKTLFNRQFSYQERGEVKGVWYKTSRWVSDIAYMNETATVSFTFAPAVLPLITQLEKHLTSYELQQVASLNSSYAVRLYEVLIAWRSIGKTPKVTIEELRNRLGFLMVSMNVCMTLRKMYLIIQLNKLMSIRTLKPVMSNINKGARLLASRSNSR